MFDSILSSINCALGTNLPTTTGGNVIDIGCQASTISPISTIGQLVQIGARGVTIAGGLAVLLYLLLGALNWITAGGDKSKVENGRNMIMNAIIGLAVLASVFAVYSIILRFFGLDDRIQITGQSSSSGSGGGAGGSGSGADTCAGGVSIGATANDGGAGGYCTSGAATVKCFGPGQGVSKFSYPHYEPCSCVNGPGAQKPGYNFSSC